MSVRCRSITPLRWWRTACSACGSGRVNVLIANPRDIHQMVKDLRKHPFNVLPAVNTLLNAMAENAEFRKLDFSGLRISIGAGMAVHKAVADKWLALTGCPIVEAYGLDRDLAGGDL